MVCKYIFPQICLLKQTSVEKSKYFLVCYLAVDFFFFAYRMKGNKPSNTVCTLNPKTEVTELLTFPNFSLQAAKHY